MRTTKEVIGATSVAFALLVAARAACAQPAGQLYAPEPPADSAYVRVLVSSAPDPVQVMVDGRPRGTKLGAGAPSDYMVLNAGKHTIALHPAGKAAGGASVTLDIVSGKSLTLAFPTLKAGAAPVVFEDKGNTNKLKALLAVYNLGTAPVDVVTADGSTKVFSAIAPGVPASIQVNPITVELLATRAGEKTELARTRLSMSHGGTYSVFLLPGKAGKLSAQAVQSRTEPYTDFSK
jgi:alginate O-acetyltransferase complex protein AlgF